MGESVTAVDLSKDENHAQESRKKDHEVVIILNGTRISIQKGKYTYEQIYELAFPGQPIPSGSEIPITYKIPHGHHEGSLLPGEAIEVREGMVFNVRPTIKS